MLLQLYLENKNKIKCEEDKTLLWLLNLIYGNVWHSKEMIKISSNDWNSHNKNKGKCFVVFSLYSKQRASWVVSTFLVSFT